MQVEEFKAALPSLDAGFRARGEEAKAQGKVLRYAAAVDASTKALVVGPAAVDADSPLGRLVGTDNLVEVYTRWYEARPLVIQGAGAGVGATAAGVLADMMELAFTKAG
jgi:homoserine dehydrogenase